MSKVKELEILLKEDVLVEVEENIEEALNILDKKKNNKEAKEELEYMEEIQAYFNDVIIDIDNNKLSEKDAEDILEVLEEMRIENQV
ncbi:MAG: hypothetical protein HRT41_13570 [Campylobacteraceae bacterium]|nr:hypothetical protein [Campylobacteraceae bacterium]